jgi:hypothetical protein
MKNHQTVVFLLEGEFEIKHGQRQGHDDQVSQDHRFVFTSNAINQPDRYV